MLERGRIDEHGLAVLGRVLGTQHAEGSRIASLVLLLAACFTLCCILLPVGTQTALQPLFFFERAWSLCLLRQMGYDLIGGEPTAERPRV